MQTFEEWCTEHFLDSIDPIDISSYELPTFDMAKRFTRELSKGSKGFNFFIIKFIDEDYYTISFILGEEDNIDYRDLEEIGCEWERMKQLYRFVKGDFVQIK